MQSWPRAGGGRRCREPHRPGVMGPGGHIADKPKEGQAGEPDQDLPHPVAVALATATGCRCRAGVGRGGLVGGEVHSSVHAASGPAPREEITRQLGPTGLGGRNGGWPWPRDADGRPDEVRRGHAQRSWIPGTPASRPLWPPPRWWLTCPLPSSPRTSSGARPPPDRPPSPWPGEHHRSAGRSVRSPWPTVARVCWTPSVRWTESGPSWRWRGPWADPWRPSGSRSGTWLWWRWPRPQASC